jgi:hypothetical protein
MFNALQKSIAFCIFLICSIKASQAQAIFAGGNNDGFAKGSYSEPDASSDIYAGGVNDGFAKSSYTQPDPANEIYGGGIQDGFAKSSYSEPDPASDIYAGGLNDGFAFNTYSEPNPAGDIYRGGNNDGFAKAFFSEELALPVEWKYFTVTKKTGRPFLEWSADEEGHCMSYAVLRSHDGKNFQSISAIDCLGKPVDNDYEFADPSPLWHRIYYYKIAQYDIDGEFTYSPIKVFNPTEPAEPEVFYKNGHLIVKTDREAKLKSVAVFDFTGRTLCSQFAEEQDAYYTIDCHLTPNQLVIIQMTFDSFTSSHHMRTGK